MSDKTIAVTGANGFVGSHVVRELLKRGYAVRALVLPGSSQQNIVGQLSHASFSMVEGDVRDRTVLQRLLQGARGVIHAAAYNQLWSPDPTLPLKINVEGTKSLLAVCQQMAIEKVVHISTATLFQNANKVICDETDFLKVESRNCYERSKWLAEALVADYAAAGNHALSLAPTVPIGPGDLFLTAPGRLILDFLNLNIPAYLKTGLNVIDVRLLAESICSAFEKGRTGEKYLVGGKNVMLKEFFEILEDISGIRAPRVRIPYALAWGTSVIGEWVSTHITKKSPRAPLEGVRLAKRPCFYSSEKANRDFGLKETQVPLALKDEIEFFYQHQMVKQRSGVPVKPSVKNVFVK